MNKESIGLCLQTIMFNNRAMCTDYMPFNSNEGSYILLISSSIVLLVILAYLYVTYFAMDSYVNPKFSLKSFSYEELVVKTLLILSITNVILFTFKINFNLNIIFASIIALIYINKM